MASFTDTWDSSFLLTPPDSQNANLGATRIRELKVSLDERIKIDHSLAGDAHDGKHKVIQLMDQSDPTLDSGDGGLYGKDVSAKIELFFKDQDGNVIQLTDAGVIKAAGLAIAQEWTRSQNFDQVAITSTSNAVAWNAATGQTCGHTLTENTTVSAPSNLKAGMFITINVTQHASSAKTLAWNAVFKGTLPTMSTTTGKQVLYSYYCPDGTNLHYVGGSEAI